MRFSSAIAIIYGRRSLNEPKETTMKEWLKPEITESEAGMEVTSYLPAELDRA
ncbi:MAG: pyrroloquinoline quinone precursor peptide PqqA [Methyloceanibacter sp.]|nr:pyrroloquinoline quinone precursor peptide PqqA [Methyloceanibacter sp.]MCB1441946.1 pyrroloquinoline quinone precursor peptide PqqA [Methyloceanibacter sp.]